MNLFNLQKKENHYTHDKGNRIKDLRLWQPGDGPGPETQAIIAWRLFDVGGDYMLDPSSIDSTFSPKNVYLSDWWVGRIVRSPLTSPASGPSYVTSKDLWQIATKMEGPVPDPGLWGIS